MAGCMALMLGLAFPSVAQASTGNAAVGKDIWDNATPEKRRCANCHSSGNPDQLPEGHRFNAANASNVIAWAASHAYCDVAGCNGMNDLAPVDAGGITTTELNDVAAYIAQVLAAQSIPTQSVTYNTALSFALPYIYVNTPAVSSPTTTTFSSIVTVTAPTKGSVSYSYSGNTATALYTPTNCQYGADSFTYQGSGPAGLSSVRTATLSITSPAIPSITSSATASGQTGVAFSYQILPSSCMTSYSVPSGLPAGLSLNTSTGLISGTPTTVATANYTVAATNVTGTGRKTVSFAITLGPPVITSANAASGVTGSAFSYTITASNNPTSYNATGLPAGLSVNTSTGVISGTPTTAGTYNTTVSATNGTATGNLSVTFTITLLAPVITSANTASGVTGSAFSYTITASNSPTSYSVPSGLPAGLNLNTSTGVISGTPTTAAGATNYTVAATNATGTGRMTLSITITLGAPVVTSASAASGVSGTNYANFYTITASNTPTSYSVPSGLPAGLSLSGSVISGTPTTAAASTNYAVCATNATATGCLTVAITINLGAPVVSSAGTASGTTGSAFSYTIAATNSPSSYSVPSGLPAGLSLSGSVISGTPTTAAASTNYAVCATNATATGCLTVAITITLGAPVVNSASTASGTTGSAFSYTITASNNPTSYSVPSGLPAGLSLSGSVISGTPTTAAASTNYAVCATNATATGCLTVAITITLGAPVVSSAGSASGATGTNYANFYTITASNTPTSYSVPSGLPAGLSLSGSVISGTPTTVAGATNYAVCAINATDTGCKTVSFTITLGAPVVSSAGSASGATGTSYANFYTITASNNPTSYSVPSGLPAGLSLSGSVISGTPTTAAGATNYAVCATNATATGCLTVAFTINLGVPVITSPNAASGDTTTAFSYTITATNSPASYSSSALPGGLTLSGNVISGTPLADGITTVAVYATNASGTSIGLDVVITISSTIPSVNSAGTASGDTGVAFPGYTITATNSPTSYSSTTLPAGLTLSGNVISGTPTAAGTFNVTVSATNASGTGSKLVVFTIALSAPVVNSAGTASGATGTNYANFYTITATNSPTSYSVPSGLPAGLSLSGSVISGTPTTVAGAANYSVCATNATATGCQTVAFTITLGVPAITSASLVSGMSGSAFSYTITATNSPTSYSSSALPGGLTLSGNVISGTPSASGISTVAIYATNGTGTGSQSVTFDISLGAPVITSASTASGSTGSAFSYTITATNSPTGYSSTALPTGLSLDAGTGAITGTPTIAGSSNVTVYATNGTGTGSQSVTFNISLSVPVVTSAGTASGTTGSAFSYQITASNSPTSFSVPSGLPAGLSLNVSSGLISGTPTTAASSTNYTVCAANGTGTGCQTVAITITLGAPVITSANSASGATGTNYANFYTITASNSPSSYSVPSGLPAGLSLSGNAISGTPTAAAGATDYTVCATNATTTGCQTVTITINLAVPVVTSANTASGVTGSALSYFITASNSPTGYGATGLPAGLSVNVVTGEISGTPVSAGSSSVTVWASNGTGASANFTVTFTISLAAPVISSAATASGTTGSAFSYTIIASNSPTLYSVPSGLPAGLTLNASTGVISGTPATAATSTNYTVCATNGMGTGCLTVAITISLSTPVITSPLSASMNEGDTFSYQITASSSPTSYAASGLPAGLSVNGSTGLISGATAVVGVHNVDISATNPAGTGSDILVLTVNALVPSAVSVDYLTVQFNTATILDLSPYIIGSGINIVVAPLHGLTVVSGKRVTFTPTLNYFGDDVFSYVATSSTGSSAIATVKIKVGRPDPTKDANVVGLIHSQIETSKRFAKAQISNFHQRMEALHRIGPAITASDPFADTSPVPGLGAARSNFYSSNGQDDFQAGMASYQNDPSRALRDDSNKAVIGSSPSVLANLLVGLLTTSSVNLSALFDDDDEEAEQDFPETVGIWGAGNVRFGKRNQATGEQVDFTTDGASLGMDRRIDEALTLGIGLGYGRDKTTIGTDGTRSTANNRSIGLYGSYQPTAATFIDGLIGYGALNYNTTRYVLAANDFALAHRKGNQTFASLTVGYEYRDEGFLLSPYGRFDLVTNQLSEATETGAGSFALKYASQASHTSQEVAGMRTEFSHKASFGWVLPHARIEYLRNSEHSQQSVMSYADVLNGPTYKLSPETANSSSLSFGIGSDIALHSGLKFGIDYQATRSVGAVGNERNRAINFKLTKEFGG